MCDGCGAIQLVYEPAHYQEALHNIPIQYAKDGSISPQIIGVFGGYGSGKSKASLQEFFIRCLENPNGVGLITAPTLALLKRTTIKTLIDEIIPPPLIEYYNKTDMEIKLINGFVIYAVASDEDQKLRSLNIGLAHMEESSAIKRSIFDQLLSRMRHPNVKNKAIFVCSNPELTWIKDVLVDNEKRKNPTHPEHSEYNPYIHVFIWRSELNKYLPPDFIEMNSKGKPDWYIKKYFLGSFEAVEGAVYPNASKCFIQSVEYAPTVKDDRIDRHGIPLSWERGVSMDWGARNPTAVYFHAIDPVKGEVITYDEYYVANTLLPDHAKNLKPRIDEIPYGRLRMMVADPSIKNKNDVVNGKSVQGLFQEYDMFFQSGNNNIEAGILRVNSYIERGKWKIFTDKCPNLAREIVNYKFKELSMDELDKNLDEKPIKAHDHSVDSCRYFFMKLPDDPDLLKTMAFEPDKWYSSDKSPTFNEYGWEDDHDYESERHWSEYV